MNYKKTFLEQSENLLIELENILPESTNIKLYK